MQSELKKSIFLVIALLFLVSSCEEAPVLPKMQGSHLEAELVERVGEFAPGVEGDLGYDRSRNRLVFVGNAPFQTWEWLDDRWVRMNTEHTPPSMVWLAIRYYPVTSTMILVGQEQDQAALQVWWYNGQDWGRTETEAVPPQPYGRLVYDSDNARLLYTAGGNYVYNHNDFSVWAFYGGDWSELPLTSQIDTYHYLTLGCEYDSRLHRLVLVGWYHGPDYHDNYFDTWEFDGLGWEPISLIATEGSAPYTIGNLVYDEVRGYILDIVGGGNTGVYRYDQGDWILIDTEEGFNAAGPVAMHGQDGGIWSIHLGETVRFTPETGWELQRPQTRPPHFDYGKAAYYGDYNAVAIVLENPFRHGHIETWLWNGSSFSRLAGDAITFEYGDFRDGSLVEDPTGQTILMVMNYYDHQGPYVYRRLGVWESRSGNWLKKKYFTPLPTNIESVMACNYPPGQSTIVLGAMTMNFTDEHSEPMQTWELSQTGWRNIRTEHAPASHYFTSMVYDPRSGNIVLFGGENSHLDCVNDTWIFDGQDWSRLTTTSAPNNRMQAALAFDTASDKVLLYGGWGSTALDDLWELTNDEWIPRAYTGNPIARSHAAVAYDPLRQVMVIAGGRDNLERKGSLLELSYQ